MSSNSISRFEELDAGRALGDLSLEEVEEWETLSQEDGMDQKIDFDLLATELELNHTEDCALSSSLATRLEDTIPAFSATVKSKQSTTGQIISIIPWLGWAAAACLVVFFNLPTGDDTQDISAELAQAKAELSDKEKTITDLQSAKQKLAELNEKLSGELASESGKIDALNTQIAKLTEKLPLLQKFESLIQDESDTQRLEFASASDPYNGLSGEVIWNDEKQEGYMSLKNLAVNDPTQNQYQLWIVDPERDELPVDGGVFNITEKDGKQIIPIRNALAINKPVAFVITLEQPGGVVKSKQEVVVALAKS
jgi:anti-sigma-K factor RskA